MKIILFANTDWYLYNFRLHLAKAIQSAGHTLVVVSPPGKYVRKIRENGITWRQLPLSRRGINPFEEAKSIHRLIGLYKDEKPDLVHHFTIKCILYGSFAARRVGVPKVVNAITGMGYLFSTPNLFTAIARPIVKILYRRFLHGSQVIFQNQRDMDLFIKERFVNQDRSILIPGSGVDTERFKPTVVQSSIPIVLLPARMLYDKGVLEFIHAAEILRETDIKARFVLVGDIDPGNPSSIPISKLKSWQNKGTIEWWGWQEDMVSIYQDASIVCLPSYREGLAKSLIEAAACGKPLIASDIPGCREVAHNGINGLLVPVGDKKALANAIQKLLSNHTCMMKMGAASRKIALKEYSAERIAAETISAYNK